MSTLRRGVYEHLLTTDLAEQINSAADAVVQQGPLDPADAHEVLTQHIARVARQALLSRSGVDQAAVSRQVDLANTIVGTIAKLAPEMSLAEEVVREPAHRLLAVVDPSGAPGPVPIPERPEVPFPTSALLVNERDQPPIGVSHTGERPMRILWHLEQALPADVFAAAKVA